MGEQKIIHKHNVNVGLSNGQAFAENDPQKYLITMVTDVGNSANINSMMPSNALERINEVGGEDDGFLPGKNRRLPAGYFILNKAEVTFFLEPEIRVDGTGKAFHVSIADVVPDAEEGIYTCVKRPEPTAPWRAYSKSAIEPDPGSVINPSVLHSPIRGGDTRKRPVSRQRYVFY